MAWGFSFFSYQKHAYKEHAWKQSYCKLFREGCQQETDPKLFYAFVLPMCTGTIILAHL